MTAMYLAHIYSYIDCSRFMAGPYMFLSFTSVVIYRSIEGLAVAYAKTKRQKRESLSRHICISDGMQKVWNSIRAMPRL